MEIILKRDDYNQVKITTNSVIIDDVLEDILNALKAYGFLSETIEDSIRNKVEEYDILDDNIQNHL